MAVYEATATGDFQFRVTKAWRGPDLDQISVPAVYENAVDDLMNCGPQSMIEEGTDYLVFVECGAYEAEDHVARFDCEGYAVPAMWAEDELAFLEKPRTLYRKKLAQKLEQWSQQKIETGAMLKWLSLVQRRYDVEDWVLPERGEREQSYTADVVNELSHAAALLHECEESALPAARAILDEQLLPTLIASLRTGPTYDEQQLEQVEDRVRAINVSCRGF